MPMPNNTLHKATHTTVQIHTHSHTHRNDIADEVLVSKLHHSVGGYKETIPSHHSSFASLYHAPPSNPPHNLLLQLELASHAHLLSLLLAVMDFCLTKHSFLYLSFCLPIPFSSFFLEFVFPPSLFSVMQLSVRCCPLTQTPSSLVCNTDM